MEYSEKYGKNVDEAVRLALEELGLREDQVMVTVIEESSKGFLGVGSKLAKVRVEKIDTAGEEEDNRSQAEALASAEKPESKATHDFRKKGHPQGQQEGAAAPEPRRQERSGGGQGAGRDGRDGRDGRRPNRDGGGSGGGRDGNRRDRDNRGREPGRDRQNDYSNIEIDISNIQRISEPIENLVPDPENAAAKFLADVLAKMGLDVQVEGFHNEDSNYIEVKGEDSRIVIGKRGQTLDALQYLTNLTSNKDTEEYKRVIIDVEGYRSRREKTLEQLAVKLAKKVLATGRNARLEPMNPYERKVIHSTLQNVDGVTTKSEGEEPYRRVIIEKG
jgi:spoIIIJ-associated protein